ncbi:hypothetical protein J4413_00710 [Candidatus Woesearchaeota archaeon]|nr:hypothetical protein [Candidatus Woesearchaeota archaeon]
MQKRGVSSQVFIYIFVIIVVGLVFLFGFQQINKLNRLNEQAVYVEFQSEFRQSIENVYNKNEGTVMTFSSFSSNKPLRLPSSIKSISFEEKNGEINVIPSDVKYNRFTVDKLKTTVSNIRTNGEISFVLENNIIDGETKVILKDVKEG